MKLHQPIGNPIYAPFLVRSTLGGYFVLAGLMKLQNIGGFIKEVKAFNILPDHLATAYAILLPYSEIAVGTLLIVGIWTTLAAGLAAMMLASFVVALGLFPSAKGVYNKDVVLLAGAISLLFSGAGALSIDRFRKSA